MSREVLERREQQQQTLIQEMQQALERLAHYTRLAELNQRRPWVAQFFCHAPAHHLGHFLDRYDFAALQTTGATMQESTRKIIRARNQRLPVEKQMVNLGGSFCVAEVLKGVIWLESSS